MLSVYSCETIITVRRLKDLADPDFSQKQKGTRRLPLECQRFFYDLLSDYACILYSFIRLYLHSGEEHRDRYYGFKLLCQQLN